MHRSKVFLVLLSWMPLLLFGKGCIRDAYKPTEIIGLQGNSKYQVRIRFICPSARSVHFAGTFNNWAVPRFGDDVQDMQYLPIYQMKPAGKTGEWELLLDLPPGMQYYRFYVDLSRWEIDERNHLAIRGADGTSYNYIVVK